MLRTGLFVVAIASGLLAAWLSLALRPPSASAPVVEKAAPAPTVEVLVATVEVARGEALTADKVRWQPWPESAAHAAFVLRSARPDAVETLTGTVVRVGLLAGEPLRNDLLVPRGGGFLSAALPSGKRAVAVRISAESTAGGFILPNDRVDVINTLARDGQAARPAASRTVLRNIPVLAIDQFAEDKGRDGGDDKARAKASLLGKTATLEVDVEQAEILAASEAMGTLSLALRSAADNDDSQHVERRPEPDAGHVIRIVRGGKAETVSTR